MTWKRVPLPDVCFFQEGPGLRKWQWKDEGMKVINVTNILTNGSIDIDNTDRHISLDEFNKKYRHFAVEAGDVVVASSGNSYGKVGRIAAEHLPLMMNTSVIRFHPKDTEQLNDGYLYAFLRSTDFRHQIERYVTGSAQPNFGPTHVKLMDVPLPPLSTQQRIAAILGAYDDLIEVNRRRVAVLEEMARGLFEEWFVRFRFPGHEDVPIIDTPDGPLPEGWEWGMASALVEFDPKTKVPKEGEKPFISMGLLDTSTSLIEPFEYRSGNSGAKFRNDDTLFARITPCLENGKTGLVRHLPPDQAAGFGSTEFIVMRGSRAGAAFAYCLARNPSFRDHAQSSMSGASGRQRARTDSVAAFEMGVPTESDLLDRFEGVAWPMLQLVGELGRTNQKLAASRDLLLPRLISGQLSVEAAERQLENAA